MKNCHYCDERPAEWILYVEIDELHDPARRPVCGHCLPESACRVSNFAFAETPELAKVVIALRR